MPSNSIPVTLIAGYLGTGKTSLVNHLLSQAAEKLKLAVLVNDFGHLAIDAGLIQTEEENIISLKGGCVCCSYGNSLVTALQQILSMETVPEHILIETSGVAHPGSLVPSIKLIPPLSINCIVVTANAESIKQQIRDRYIGSTVDTQLNSADLVLLNKVDLVEKDNAKSILQWLRKDFPATRVIATVHSALAPGILFDSYLSTKESLLNTPAKSTSYSHNESLVRLHESLFTTFVLSIPDRLNLSTLVHFLKSENANLLRAKGCVQGESGITLVQIVGNRAHIENVSVQSERMLPGKIVCIAIRDQFDKTHFSKGLKSIHTDLCIEN